MVHEPYQMLALNMDRKIVVLNEAVGPHQFHQLFLADDPPTALDEHSKNLDGLGR